MRAVIYARVSSDPHATGRSVEQQEDECRQVCAAKGWTVAQVFTDNDRSASRHARKDRPAYAQLKSFLQAGKADVLVLWEGSRAQRDLRDYLKLRDICAERGVLYCYSGKVHDLTRTDDRFTTGLDALLAEREADLTRDRVMRAVRANMVSGRPFGRLLYGYRRVYDDRGLFVEQVPHEEQAAVVRDAARRVLAGESCRSIAQDLNGRGVAAPAGGQWDLTQIKRLVTRPSYAGYKVHKGQVVGKGDWPPLLDEQTYALCVSRLSDPRRKTMRDGAVKHLLSGSARCGVCDGRLSVLNNRGYHAYACRVGFCISVRSTRLEEYVTNVVLERLSQPDAMEALFSSGGDDLAAQARQERDELRARLESFYEQAADGKISSVGLATIEARILPQIEDAERRARPASLPPVIRDLAGSRVREVWEGLSVAVRREVVDVLVDIRVGTTTRGSRRPLGPDRVEITWK